MFKQNNVWGAMAKTLSALDNDQGAKLITVPFSSSVASSGWCVPGENHTGDFNGAKSPYLCGNITMGRRKTHRIFILYGTGIFTNTHNLWPIVMLVNITLMVWVRKTIHNCHFERSMPFAASVLPVYNYKTTVIEYPTLHDVTQRGKPGTAHTFSSLPSLQQIQKKGKNQLTRRKGMKGSLNGWLWWQDGVQPTFLDFQVFIPFTSFTDTWKPAMSAVWFWAQSHGNFEVKSSNAMQSKWL